MVVVAGRHVARDALSSEIVVIHISKYEQTRACEVRINESKI